MWFIWDLSGVYGERVAAASQEEQLFCPGVVCCPGRAASQSPHWSQWTETADTTCALSGSIFGAGKSIEIRLRMCGPPLFQIYMLFAQINAVVILFGRVGLAILRSHFWYRRTVPKMAPWTCFSFVLLLSCACGPKQERQAVPFLGPCF